MDILQMDLNMGKSGFAHTLPNDRLKCGRAAVPLPRTTRPWARSSRRLPPAVSA